MKWTAYLHPDFTEELSLLPPILRIQFYAQIVTRAARGAFAENLDYYYPPNTVIGLKNRVRFHMIGHAPVFHALFTVELSNQVFTYLCLTQSGDDAAALEKASLRRTQIDKGQIEPLEFEEFFLTIDATERIAALDINAAVAQRGLNNAFLTEAMTAARAEAATIFNLCAPQMDRFMTRTDYFLDVLNRHLRDKGASFTLTVHFTGSEPIHVPSLKHLQDRTGV